MRKPIHLLQSQKNSRRQLYIYIDADAKYESYKKSYHVSIKDSNESDWKEIPIIEFEVYRDGGTTSISLRDSDGKSIAIYIPTVWNNEKSYIQFNNGDYCFLDKLNIALIETPFPNVLPLPKPGDRAPDFNDLCIALTETFEPYCDGSETDIFEHTMLRLAGVFFPFNGHYECDKSKKMPDHFFMDLGLPEKSVEEFVSYLNAKYGIATARYLPEFNSKGSLAVCLNIKTTIEKILPDVTAKLPETFSNPIMVEAYKKGFSKLDDSLQQTILERNRIANLEVEIFRKDVEVLFADAITTIKQCHASFFSPKPPVSHTSLSIEDEAESQSDARQAFFSLSL